LSQYSTTYELQTAGQEPLFPLHATPSQIHEGIKSGKLLQGSFLASRENFLEGQVSVEGQDKMVSSYKTVVYKIIVTAIKSTVFGKFDSI